MAEDSDRLERAGATVVVVSFETRDRAAPLRDRLNLPFVIALDPQKNGYRNFELRQASFLRTYTHPGVVSFYARALLQGHIPHLRRGQDRRQLGGDFVLDRDGVIVLAHPERGPEDRAPIGSILRAVEDAAW